MTPQQQEVRGRDTTGAPRRSVGLRFLSHPLTLLVVGAALSSILIPAFTNNAQKKARALDLQRSLALQVTSASSPFLATMLSVELRWRGRPTAEYDEAYESWTARSGAIATALHSYYPESSLEQQWAAYSSAVRWMYYLFKVGATPVQSRYIILSQYVHEQIVKWGCSRDDCDLRIIAEFFVPRKGVNPSLDLNFRRLLAAVRNGSDRIVDQILRTEPAL